MAMKNSVSHSEFRWKTVSLHFWYYKGQVRRSWRTSDEYNKRVIQKCILYFEYIPRRLFKQSYTCFVVFLKVNLRSEIIFSLSIFLKCIALQLISASELITLFGTLDCRFNCKFAKVPRCKVLTTVSWPCFNYCKWQRLNSWNMCSPFPTFAFLLCGIPQDSFSLLLVKRTVWNISRSVPLHEVAVYAVTGWRFNAPKPTP